MKKILLFSGLFTILGLLGILNVQGQLSDPASCPIIMDFNVSPAGPGNWKIDFDYQNATSGNKWVKVVVLCNNNPVSVTPNCFDVPKNQTSITHYTSSIFSCTSLTSLLVFVESWVGNACGGTLCQRQISIGGSPLPVDFKSFSATRSRSNVLLKWETASEQNNNGFVVERSINDIWEQVSFVKSQAANGNSDAVLSYTFNDVNTIKGITQYRIKQVDMDAKSKFSAVRSVKGEGQTGKIIVYPNPTNDGRVNVVFDELNVNHDIFIMDMSGRLVNQMRSVSNNTVTIDNLKPGLYSLRIVTIETGEQSIQKIVVNKR